MKNKQLHKALLEAQTQIRGSRLSPEDFTEARDMIIKLAVTLSYTKHPGYSADLYSDIPPNLLN